MMPELNQDFEKTLTRGRKAEATIYKNGSFYKRTRPAARSAPMSIWPGHQRLLSWQFQVTKPTNHSWHILRLIR